MSATAARSDDAAAAQLAERLREIVGDRFVLERPGELLAYESDGLPGYHRRPRLAVFPGSRDETVAVVRVLADADAAFVARGAGTGLSGGALADDVVLLGVHRLKRVIDVDVAHLRATVEPGVVNAALNRRLAAQGVFYAPDPSSESACTIGGNVAENAGGPHCLKYGVTLNHVLAATVILPDGEIVTLGDADGTMRGYDLLGAFIGSEGCFGVVLGVTVRLTRRPESVRTALADFTSVDAAARATSAIIASGVLPAALEFMDHAAIRVVEESVYAAGYPADAAAVLLIEVDGTRASVEHDLERVRALCEESGARTVRVARDDAERAKLWQGRKKAFGAMGRMAPHLVVQDAVIPRTRLPDVLAAIHAIADAHGVVVCNVFHAGDGNLHPNIAYDANDPVEAERVHAAMSAIMHACIDAGGSITGEHGVGLDKLGYMPDLFDGPTLAAMCDLRGVFDAERRANPGKVVPVRSCREWHATPAGRAAGHAGDTRMADASPAAGSMAAGSMAGVAAADRRVADAVRDAASAGAGVRIAGAGAWLDAGHPVRAAHTLSLAADRGIVAYSPGDLTITVRAGTTLGDIAEALREHGQWLALDPEGGMDVTIGATVATGSFGPAAALYGTVRDQLLGLTVVTGRGEIVRPGGRVVKNVAGFDLTRLMTGAWGSLGIITEVTLRVRSSGLASGSVAHLARIMPARSGYREPVMLHERLGMRLKRTFDPAHVLNPGIMGETVQDTTTAGAGAGAGA